ncbi:MAG: ATP synthase subunit I [Mariprofundaceae bacterium]
MSLATNNAPSYGIRIALFWQLGASVPAVLATTWVFGVGIASGVMFGVFVTMLSTVLLGRRIEAAAQAQPEAGQRMLYAGAVVRFIAVLVALVLAYGLGLHLLAVAAGMLLAQLAMFVYAAKTARQGFAE